MNILENFIHLFNQNRSYGIGVLEENVTADRIDIKSEDVVDRRGSSRVDISVPVWYHIKSDWTKWLLGKSVDHSDTGIRLALPSKVKPGTEISIRLKLPDSPTPVNLKGVVVWTAPGDTGREMVECGVAFKDIRKTKQKEKLVYLIANKLCKIGLSFTRHIVSQPVQTVDELKECFRTVYEGYVARRYCAPNAREMHYHHYSFLPESRTFILKEKNRAIGTISVVVDSPCGLPMESLFPREVEHLRQKGRKLAEVSLLAMAGEQNKKKMFSLTNFDKQVRLFRLFKIMYEYAHHVAGVTDLIIGVHPKHETLYKYLSFKAMSSPRSYPGARGNPALPLHLDLVWAKDNYSSCLKAFFLEETPQLDHLQGGLKITPDLVQKFLCEDSTLWSHIPVESQKFIRKCYPGIIPKGQNPLFNIFRN